MGLLSGLLQAIASIFGLAKQRDKELNSPAMQKNAEAQVEQKTQDQVIHDVVSGDLEHIREDAS